MVIFATANVNFDVSRLCVNTIPSTQMIHCCGREIKKKERKNTEHSQIQTTFRFEMNRI
jgi:hypothetical protein